MLLNDSVVQTEKSMFLLLRPMIRDEFIGGMVALQIKYRLSNALQFRHQVGIVVLTNSAGSFHTEEHEVGALCGRRGRPTPAEDY